MEKEIDRYCACGGLVEAGPRSTKRGKRLFRCRSCGKTTGKGDTKTYPDVVYRPKRVR